MKKMKIFVPTIKLFFPPTTFYIKAPKKISVNKLLTSKLRANIYLPLLQYLKGHNTSLYFLQWHFYNKNSGILIQTRNGITVHFGGTKGRLTDYNLLTKWAQETYKMYAIYKNSVSFKVSLLGLIIIKNKRW